MRYGLSRKDVLEEVTKIGPKFSINSRNGVVALCTMIAVADAEERYRQKRDDGICSDAQAVVLLVRPTFTIAKDKATYRPVHTGFGKELTNSLIQSILKKIFGCALNYDPGQENDCAQLDEIGRVLCKEDARIYVPFAANPDPVWQTYEKTDVQMLISAFLAEIPELPL